MRDATSAFSRHDFARVLHFVVPLSDRGRRESRALTAPAAPCAKKKNAHGLVRYSRDIPAFPAQWLYDLLRALPGERRLLSPLPPQHRPERIDATVAAPGPHDFAVRCRRYVRRANPPDATASIATRATFRDDREPSLMAARAERTSASDLPDGAREIFDFGFHEFVKAEATAPGSRICRRMANTEARDAAFQANCGNP